MKKETWLKIGKIAGDVAFAIFMIFVLFIAIINLRAKSNNGIPNIFGKGYVSVLTDSMNGDKEDSFKEGDLIVVDVITDNNRDELTSKIEVGSIITYYDNKEEKIISHRVVGVSNDEFVKTYKVKGDNPTALLTTEVFIGDVLAIYNHKVAGVGSVMNWFASGIGFFIIVVLPCILFLVYEVYKFVKVLIEYQNEKNNSNKEEKSKDELLKLRKEALDALVNDGIITKEQAEEKFKEYEESLNKADEVVEKQPE